MTVDDLERIRTDAGIAWLTGEIGKLLVTVEAERSSRQAWAQEAMRLEMAAAKLIDTLAEDLAWQKSVYQKDEGGAVLGRIIGTEDALRTARQLLGGDAA